MGSENGWDNLAGTTSRRELVSLYKFSSANALTFSTDPLAAGINTQIVATKQMAVLAARLTSMVVGAITDRIQRVIAACTPGEILQAVVRFVIIKVPAHQPLRPGANEGFQHQMMDTASAAARENYGQTSSATIYWLENTSGRTYFTSGTDCIAFNFCNRLPHAPILEGNHAK